MIASIHQPNYLLWVRLVHKIALSDVFVVFDDVQLVRGKSFVLRAKIKTEGGSKWLTIPVKNKSSMLMIKEVTINDEVNWREKHCNSLISNYHKSEFFDSYYKLFENIIRNSSTSLLELNLSLTKLILEILKIDTKIIKSSELNVSGTGIEKILNILESVKAKKFLSGLGKGAKRYTIGNEELFKKRGFEVIYQKFNSPAYQQLYGEFVPNLSIIDLLFNCGSKSLDILMNSQNTMKN